MLFGKKGINLLQGLWKKTTDNGRKPNFIGEYTPLFMLCIKKHVLELENLMFAPGESFQALQNQTKQNPIHDIAKTIVLLIQGLE